ncbi:MAG: hypothetical protein J7K22_02180 [Nanoarchaeota archaeon]|nr:hypothetical protein [Nanoarchaeota archaeon]
MNYKLIIQPGSQPSGAYKIKLDAYMPLRATIGDVPNNIPPNTYGKMIGGIYRQLNNLLDIGKKK